MDNKLNADFNKFSVPTVKTEILSKTFEVNGNLEKVDNFDIFLNNIIRVYSMFEDCFGKEIMSRIDLYVDNATGVSAGYTPIATVILKKYIIIKLGIDDFTDSVKTVFQFSHELCHYVFYSLKGITIGLANGKEESICTAMSLIVINSIMPNEFDLMFQHVSGLENNDYRQGAEVAKNIDFDINKLKELILNECN